MSFYNSHNQMMGDRKQIKTLLRPLDRWPVEIIQPKCFKKGSMTCQGCTTLYNKVRGTHAKPSITN